MGDILGLLVLAAIVAAVFLACRRIKSNQAAAVASARADSFAQGEASVLARIGASVVVHNHNGDGVSVSAREHDNDDYPGYLDRAAFDSRVSDRLRGAHARLGLGVPVAGDSVGADGDVRAERAASLAEVMAHDPRVALVPRSSDGC